MEHKYQCNVIAYEYKSANLQFERSLGKIDKVMLPGFLSYVVLTLCIRLYRLSQKTFQHSLVEILFI